MLTFPFSRRLALVTTVAAIAVAGCGSSLPNRDAQAGDPVELGGVQYQVQFSRQLNPNSVNDRPLFAGVPGAGLNLPGNQIWLGVFIQADNISKAQRRTASSFTVADAFDHVFRPVPLPASNDLAYRPDSLAPGDVDPGPDSPAGDGPDQGALLLFHMPADYFLGDRPLELRISGDGGLATVQLDV
jgi:hypothetical protein